MKCPFCEHPKHAADRCEKPLDEPFLLYGRCDCPTGHEHCPDLRKMAALPVNEAGFSRPDGGHYTAPCDLDICDVKLVVILSRPTDLDDHRGWPITGDWMTEAEAAESASEEASHLADLERGYARDR
jgi:hypothetical protein